MKEQGREKTVAAPFRNIFRTIGSANYVIDLNGGSDGARTRDLRRDRPDEIK
ncbi:hypothetical protein GCM10028812_51730 [Ancylobacter sonchi]